MFLRFGLLLAVCGMLVLGAGRVESAERSDLVIADFEGADYGGWQTTGEAFGKGPARGTLPGQMPVEGFEGKGLVNSFLNGDSAMGTLTSPEFTIERRFLSFLIGGGKHDGKTCINLLVKEKIVRTASGPNEQPGGSERLEWHSWDVAEWEGQKAQLQIVDHVSGGWGHINVDQILQSDRRRGTALAQRELVLEHSYLHLPVKTGAAKRLMKFTVGGETVREFEIELAEAEPDFHVFADVKRYWRQKLTISAQLPAESKVLDQIVASDTVPTPTKDYHEALRPQFHFTSRRGWLNDPNGLVFFQGEWHLCYQHNPYGWNWGNMHWGHAVSRDLVHWYEQPTALYPKAGGDFAFSGSAIVDERNDAGFQKEKEPVLIAFFTSTGRGECLAYSDSLGRLWQEYDKNPVVKHAGRDPKVVWHEASRTWIMAVYDEPPQAERGIAFYTSKNLKDWTFASRINGFYECPDLFPIAVGDEEKWVLYGADGKYLIGTFDGKQFLPQGDKLLQVWHGNFYAAQTYSNAPNGRRVQIGWANGVTFPGMPFNQQMTIPVELSLKKTSDGLRMFAWPVAELASLAAGSPHTALQPQTVEHELLLSNAQLPLDLFDFSIAYEPRQAKQVTLNLAGTPVIYDAGKQTLTCRHVIAPLKPVDGKLKLRVLGDRNSFEIFANDGQVAMSVAGMPSKIDRTSRITTDGGVISITSYTIQPLKSAWGNR